VSPIIERGGCKGGLGGQATEDATFGGGAADPATEALASASGTTTYGEGATPGDAESVPRPLDTIYTSKYALQTLPARSTQTHAAHVMREQSEKRSPPWQRPSRGRACACHGTRGGEEGRERWGGRVGGRREGAPPNSLEGGRGGRAEGDETHFTLVRSPKPGGGAGGRDSPRGAALPPPLAPPPEAMPP
jgi:hypothetical protein